ncbi:dihydropteroate synthase [Myxococcaceae bacterium JPH2]|nr:dihydropteroate synthase [Myxococcaceae bacterium JPH2]
MIRARPICLDRPEDLELALRRMGLPESSRESSRATLPHAQVLLTGLTSREEHFLQALAAAPREAGREAIPSWLPGAPHSRPGTGLLSGSRARFGRLVAEARADGSLSELVTALARVLEMGAPLPPLVLGGRTFELGSRTFVMGVVNVTPDSFSDGGRYFGVEAAIARGLALAEAGADVLDVGGESTRPGSRPVSVEEELARVLPVLEGLRARTQVPLSVDTTKAEVARAALRVGASLVNDVTGFHSDPALPAVVAESGAACCLMHTQGAPATMQQAPRYDDVVDEVLAYLEAGVAQAQAAGVPRERILVDPGIGFGKTAGHNLLLLRRMGELRVLGLPLLVGTSRKRFLGTLTGDKPPSERLAATLGSVAALAALGGADFVRVHDVAEARDALAVADALRGAADGGDLYSR